MIFTINECSIDTDAYEVRRNGNLIRVEPQVFDLLVQLLENRDRLVTKDEIIARVWNGRVVSEAALSSRIKAVRQAIGDDGASQALIRTVRRRGFRVVAEVTQRGGPGDASASAGATTTDIRSEDTGSRRQPNSDRPRIRSAAAVVALTVAVALGAAAGWYAIQPARHAATPIAPAALGMPVGPGIAVLRFNNPSGDSTLDFLEGALTEEIVTQLTRFSELRVATRALTSEYDRNELDVKDVGRRLGVEFLVQGSLRRSADRVRLTAQLIKATDGRLLWAESYERQLTPADIFAVQEDIAGKVVAAVASISAGVIARQTLDQARGKPPRDLSAYECTIRTSEIMVAGFSAASHLTARTCLEAAIASEPDYAAAWAMLAWIHTLEFTQDMNKRPGSDGREQALAAARRAIELAPANSMARFAMARASYLMQDLDVFYAEAAQALRLNPHEPFLLGNLGNWLSFSGRWDEGVAMIRKAIALNPKVYPRWWHAALGKNHYRKGEFREALVEFKNMNLPNWWWNQVELAYTYGQLGDAENARAAVMKLSELYPGFDLEKAVLEHRKFSFEQSYIELAVDGLRKAGVPERSPSQAKL
jgi:TolB-like protein/DNA-binding winged helix-turn-helix (wHTH) protein/Tfp pilus assembly protein PilF